MHKRVALIVIAFILVSGTSLGGLTPGGDSGSGSSDSSSASSGGGGGGGSKQISADSFIRMLKSWQNNYPIKFDEIKTLLYKEPYTTTEYKVPMGLIRYDQNKTISRNEKVTVNAAFWNYNPIEIRRVLYFYLEEMDPGETSYKQVSTQPQLVQTNEYGEKENSTVRGFPELENFRRLKTTGVVKLRLKYTDGIYDNFSTDYKNVPQPYYSYLTLNVFNNPPLISNLSIIGNDPPRYKDPLEYVADVSDPDGDLINVTLHILDDAGAEKRNASQEIMPGQRVAFKSGEYSFFSEADAGKNFTYYYTYGDDINVSRTDVASGPHFKPNTKIFVENPRVEPENMNCYWWQKYTFSLDVRNQNPEDVNVTFKLYTSTPKHQWQKYKDSQTVRLTQEPQTIVFDASPFDVSDASHGFSYSFNYSESDQHGNDNIVVAYTGRINPKLIKYDLISLLGLFNLAVVLFVSLLGGIFVERRFYR